MTESFPNCEYLSLDQRGFHLTITFDRPETRNAMNVAMARELGEVFEAATANSERPPGATPARPPPSWASVACSGRWLSHRPVVL